MDGDGDDEDEHDDETGAGNLLVRAKSRTGFT